MILVCVLPWVCDQRVAGARVISKFPSFRSLAINSGCVLGAWPRLNAGSPGLLSVQAPLCGLGFLTTWCLCFTSKHLTQTRSQGHGPFLPALEVTQYTSAMFYSLEGVTKVSPYWKVGELAPALDVRNIVHVHEAHTRREGIDDDGLWRLATSQECLLLSHSTNVSKDILYILRSTSSLTPHTARQN